MPEIVETAWAKINLALHVTGRREDGYHLIDSLVTFADFGDVLSFAGSENDSLSINGEFGGTLTADGDNLVAKARDFLRHLADKIGHSTQPVAIHLEKNLPVASGVGGGSADAAACLRGLMRLWQVPEHGVNLTDLATGLGADVPMCITSTPLIASGIGENIAAADWLAALPIVLVNPLTQVSTQQVFGALSRKDNEPLKLKPSSGDRNELAGVLRKTRNDLQKPATALAPVIDEVMVALAEYQPVFHRMSGSGATCFAIFQNADAARLADEALRDKYLQWWVRSGMTRAAS
ncbi:MAG: 4-(cytidine 5'-diphospho)-2-C-methyl-D-erythritol kinase [Hyphomicrobiales bacterium]|nr:4-(cytidine 5'-diphospho)-2-C-methyl-D-erythritol kinase [Hyphomicrobiales bacterium]MCP4999788.1 4-(cytidine 5'-diphospho)-2-C-methyl-D-erythritol kinase [Hyphomicrobiales bacterium]